MIALSALLEDTVQNAFVEEFRPALWTEACTTLPKSVFDYSVKALKKALVSLRSAYGPVRIFNVLSPLTRLDNGSTCGCSANMF